MLFRKIAMPENKERRKMKISDVSRYAMSLCAAGAVLTGCTSAQQEAQTVPYSQRLHSAQATESIIYSFQGGTDGDGPFGLIDVNGTFYGFTRDGGANGDGDIFTMTTSGVESIFYSFKGSPTDGSADGGTLLKSGHYGISGSGGTYDKGTVFKVTTSGTETVLHSFRGGADGQYPSALINVNGTFYGTTEGGRSRAYNGTVFSITPAGTYKVLYRFAGEPDGRLPVGLINVNGVLYGTTVYGGALDQGSIFSIATSGTEHVLYSFTAGRNGSGQAPVGLTNVGGTLYGVTKYGGTAGYGSVFKIGLSGTPYKVLHTFTSGNDGEFPSSGLTNVNGVLYGTASVGGTGRFGIVYSITTSGTENVLYSFTGPPDGQDPDGLIYVNGMFYGTTELGGTGKCTLSGGQVIGCGAVFSITP
jgi:uncharacterized repeat protein (TIGR03803 family)